MNPLAYFAMVAIPVLVFLVAGCLKVRAASTEARVGGGGESVTPESSTSDQRADMAQRLEQLAATDPPQGLPTIGAMCYEPTALPASAEYVCPECGARTQYGVDEALVVKEELPACRREVKEIPVLRVRLDETTFCRKCSPKAKDPKLALLIRYRGQSEPLRVEGVGWDDLKLLREFLEGSDRHKGERDAETALVDHVGRLRVLLGFPEHWTKAETSAQLAELSAAPVPTDLNTMGAMCYKPAAPAQRTEYVCPTCGERTVYSGALASTVERDLASCRRLIASLPLLDASLDESQFCRKCSPEVTAPQLTLVVRYVDGAEKRATPVTPEDLVLLREFERGQTKHEGPMGRETPLLEHRARLGELLGLIAPPTGPDAPRNAMCYAAGPRPQSVGYLCPDCGERTLYPMELAAFFHEELPALRRARGADRLDESPLCRSCRPEATDEEIAVVLRGDVSA
jgi:predicted RNA-binding Zn-ribbon protein involved in translation (DUF1610 family)